MSDAVDLTDLAKSMRRIKYHATLPEKPERPEITRRCPRCNGKLQQRTRRSDGKTFIGCENFFTEGCKYTENTNT